MNANRKRVIHTISKLGHRANTGCLRLSNKLCCFGLSFFLAINFSLGALGQSQPGNPKSCRTFVEGFYNWYVPETKKENAGCSSYLALKYKGSAFSPELLRELKIDQAAQEKAVGELVGLDFDPFLATNDDPYERYVVGNASPKGDRYWVQIYGIHAGKKSKTPVVVPELVFTHGRWTFVNFHYEISKFPENENLLSVLNVLKKDREKYAH